MTEPTAQARALLQSIVNIYPSTVGIIGPDYEPGQRLIAGIASLILQAKREGLEEAAKVAEEKASKATAGFAGAQYNYGYRSGLYGLASEFRQRAKESRWTS